MLNGIDDKTKYVPRNLRKRASRRVMMMNVDRRKCNYMITRVIMYYMYDINSDDY